MGSSPSTEQPRKPNRQPQQQNINNRNKPPQQPRNNGQRQPQQIIANRQQLRQPQSIPRPLVMHHGGIPVGNYVVVRVPVIYAPQALSYIQQSPISPQQVYVTPSSQIYPHQPQNVQQKQNHLPPLPSISMPPVTPVYIPPKNVPLVPHVSVVSQVAAVPLPPQKKMCDPSIVEKMVVPPPPQPTPYFIEIKKQQPPQQAQMPVKPVPSKQDQMMDNSSYGSDGESYTDSFSDSLSYSDDEDLTNSSPTVGSGAINNIINESIRQQENDDLAFAFQLQDVFDDGYEEELPSSSLPSSYPSSYPVVIPASRTKTTDDFYQYYLSNQQLPPLVLDPVESQQPQQQSEPYSTFQPQQPQQQSLGYSTFQPQQSLYSPFKPYPTQQHQPPQNSGDELLTMDEIIHLYKNGEPVNEYIDIYVALNPHEAEKLSQLLENEVSSQSILHNVQQYYRERVPYPSIDDDFSIDYLTPSDDEI